MTMYLIGDVQGCDDALQRLLDKIAFSPSRDVLYVLGDLVNRGPDSVGVLRRLAGLEASARCLLGNHDLHLLAIAHGVRKPHRKDTLEGVLHAADRPAMLDWLQHQRLAMLERIGGQELLMVHAGVLPAWTASKTIALASEMESVLQSADAPAFFHTMYGNAPSAWTETLAGTDRHRVIVNALTRLRFCTPAGDMEFDTKDSAATAPVGYLPWFEVPGRRTGDITVAFGHWSTLGHLDRTDVLSMDTGCVWGGCLSALRLDVAQPPGTGWTSELIQVRCEQAQAPGKP